MEKKKALKIAVAVISIVACVVAVFFIGWGAQKCRVENEALKRDARRYVMFTDRATGKTYNDVSPATITYDGRSHQFTYDVYRQAVGNETGSKLLESGTAGTISEVGTMPVTVQNYYKNKLVTVRWSVKMVAAPKLQPEMKFDPNGAIEYRDGEYYKYKYTGEKCYPIAYGEYEGIRLDAAREPEDLIEGCYKLNPKVSAAYPKEIGTYEVRFWIGNYEEDPEMETYSSVRKTITVEIVE